MSDILFFGDSVFIRKEIELLGESFSVRQVKFRGNGILNKILSVLKNLKAIRNTKIVFLWFGGPISTFITIISKLLGKKVIIHCGGFETVNMPEIGYGMQYHPIKRFIYNLGFKLADYTFCSSKAHAKESIRNTGIKKFDYIHPYFDPNTYKPKGKKQNIVVTICGVHNNPWTLEKKGLKYFIEAAKKLPQYKFYVIGKIFPDGKKLVEENKNIKNLVFTDYLKEEDKIRLLQKAKVYCQLSGHESFGWAVAEAMLCECVPVVTDRCALPEVVGNAGFYVKFGDVEDAVKKIRLALKSSKGKLARQRVIKLFNKDKKRRKTYKIIKQLLH